MNVAGCDKFAFLFISDVMIDEGNTFCDRYHNVELFSLSEGYIDRKICTPFAGSSWHPNGPIELNVEIVVGKTIILQTTTTFRRCGPEKRGKLEAV